MGPSFLPAVFTSNPRARYVTVIVLAGARGCGCARIGREMGHEENDKANINYQSGCLTLSSYIKEMENKERGGGKTTPIFITVILLNSVLSHVLCR